jgi:chromosomal replication initiation ATPase DnaA
MPPDDVLLAAILATQLKSRGSVPDPKSYKYAIDRLPRTFDAVLDFVDRIDSASLQTKKPITFPLIKSVLEATQYI